MIYVGAVKRYQLYSITEHDIALTGGEEASRYINNTIFVFLPDIEKPEIGKELLATELLFLPSRSISSENLSNL